VKPMGQVLWESFAATSQTWEANAHAHANYERAAQGVIVAHEERNRFNCAHCGEVLPHVDGRECASRNDWKARAEKAEAAMVDCENEVIRKSIAMVKREIKFWRSSKPRHTEDELTVISILGDMIVDGLQFGEWRKEKGE